MFAVDGDGKVKWSNFHVTVNFNVNAEDHLDTMRTAVEDMADTDHLWSWLKQYNGRSQMEFDEDTKPLVERVRLRAAFEHGGQQNRGLHVHIVIEVAHSTMVQIDKQGLVRLFRTAVGLTPNVHCRFIKGEGEDKDFCLRYLSKEVPDYVPRHVGNKILRSVMAHADQVDVDEEVL
jgi:hypothetical protein